ncbi:MAG TPA: O-antigen ligase family protein [Chthoniobacterales bacterium]
MLLFAFPGFAVIGLAALIGVAFAQPRAYPSTVCLAATAIFCAYILSRAAVTGGYFARRDLFTVLAALVVYGTTATLVTSSRARLVIVLTLLAAAMINVVVGAVQFSRGDNFMLLSFLQRTDYGQRASGFLVCPNHLAGFLEVVGIFGVAVSCWSRWPVWLKMLVGYASGICYIGLALTGSRGGYVSTIASFVVFVALSILMLRAAFPARWFRFGLIGAVTIALTACAGIVLIHESSFLSARASSVIDQKNVRMTLWKAAVQQWRLQPVIGTGAGTYRFYGREFRNEEMQNDPVDVHNDYLHLLCEYGLVGAAAFVIFFGAHLKYGCETMSALIKTTSTGGASALSNRTALFIGAWSAIGAYVVHSALDFNLHIPSNALLLAFVFGIAANPRSERHSTKTQQSLAIGTRWATALCAVLVLAATIRFAPGEFFTERARTALRDEDPVASLEFGRKAVAYDGSNPELFFYLGRAHMACAHRAEDRDQKRSCFEESVAAFRRATELAPLDGTYALDLAFAYDEMGRFEDAERMYSTARIRDPHSTAVSQLYSAHLQTRRKAAESGNPSL